jgi:DNA mismatch repair ATPase MutS
MIPGRSRQALAELEALTVIIKAVFLIDLIRYNHTINAMIKNKNELNKLFGIVGETDAAICIASFRQSLKHYCLPGFHEERSIVFDGMYHPLLRKPVTNSGMMGNSSIITGSNASGKSTFIKGLAVNTILAQTLHTCCAERYCLKYSYVATSMALRDNIVSGESYFVAEIKSLKRIVAFTKAQYCTCFIDEILRGTNTRERIAASTAVLKLLHETGSLCVVASHDVELTEILNGIYNNYHFSEKIIGNEIAFDYHLKDGPSRTTNAIKLLEYMGFDKRIVDEANELSNLD